MIIKLQSTRNFTEYHFQLSSGSESQKCPDTLGKVLIIFENGKFSRCEFPFRGTYNPVLQAVEHIESIYNHRGGTVGLASGLRDLDRSTGGFLGGQMIVIAARPCWAFRPRKLMVRAVCSEASIDFHRARARRVFHDGEVWRFVSGDRIESQIVHWAPFPEPPTTTPSSATSPKNNTATTRMKGKNDT